MNDTTAGKLDAAALVVFGQTEKGGRHAAWFTTAESANAKKAAALSSLAVIEPIPTELVAILPKIARGKFVMGQISLSKADPGAYEKLLNQLSASKKDEQAEGEETETEEQPAPTPAVPNTPAVASTTAELWQRIKIGDTVLAPYEGWWKARIIGIYSDKVRLAWDGGEPDEYEDLPRSSIALLFPKT